MKKYVLSLTLLILFACNSNPSEVSQEVKKTTITVNTSLVILGNLQDAGSPHIGCTKKCCKDLFEHPDENRQVVSLGLVDHQNNKRYLFEATPDISRQVKALKNIYPSSEHELPDGIFITHAHIGHYTGLMYLGKEAINAPKIPVYAMSKMTAFLQTNGPWSQLVTNQNIELRTVENGEAVTLTSNIEVTPMLVPHRDEYSETVGYKIEGPSKSALFIPDIDKWEKWEKSIIEEIKKVDYAFLDATFFSGAEINNRDISKIPHPFVIESMEQFKDLTKEEKAKIIFIHFNHTNPIIDPSSKASKIVLSNGFKLGRLHDEFKL